MKTWIRLVRSELRKISTTRLHWGFVAILMAISAATGTAIAMGTDADGTKGFIATADDQRSLLAFGANAMIIAGLFGAIAAARDFDHHTVVPMFLLSPKRHVAMLAQFVAISLAGGLLGLTGEALTMLAALVALPVVDMDFLMSFDAVIVVSAASILGGAAGAALGAGVGSLLRNSAFAVTAAVVLLIIAPPLMAQLLSDASWAPATLLGVISGVEEEPGISAALAVLAAWVVTPPAIAVFLARRRDVI
jgi:ABC-2 type transport system permease protein